MDNELRCDKCGAQITEPIVVNGDNVYLCDSCFDETYSQCERCSAYTEGLLLETRDGNMCQECAENYVACDICDELVHRYNMWIVGRRGRTICYRCGESLYICSVCGDIIDEDDANFDENDTAFCSDCWLDHGGCLHEYDYKPYPVFYPSEGLRRYFGVENELDNGGSKRATVSAITREAREWLYCKHDGSLDDGIELVTHPSTLSYHQEVAPWQTILLEATNRGWQSDSARTTGLHIHVNRRSLGEDESDQDYTIAKVLILVDHLWDSMVTFSRRDYVHNYNDYHYACKMNLGVEPEDLPHVAVEKAGWQKDKGRYYAINLENRRTIEFRMFKGTMHASYLLAAIEFVDAICEFALAHSVRVVQTCTWDKLRRFCLAHAEYTHLAEYFEGRGL